MGYSIKCLLLLLPARLLVCRSIFHGIRQPSLDRSPQHFPTAHYLLSVALAVAVEYYNNKGPTVVMCNA